MTTFLEIVDTAVKIGLGAAISGLSTYILSAKSFKQTIDKSKLEAKGALVKESVLKYEEAMGYLSKMNHDLLLHGIERLETLDDNTVNELAEYMLQARLSMSHAQSCARLAGLTELADCYEECGSQLTTMDHLLADDERPNRVRVAEIVYEIAILWRKIQPLICSAYDIIYSSTSQQRRRGLAS